MKESIKCRQVLSEVINIKGYISFMTEKPDEYFMNRVKNGDPTAMAELFERHPVKLYNFMLKLTFDKIVSQDLTQNQFYRIIKYRHTFNPRKHLLPETLTEKK